MSASSLASLRLASFKPSSSLAAAACLLGLTLAGITAAQAATMGQLPYIPTRFHLCSVELADLEGEAREEEMAICLKERFQAEKVVRRNCAQQMKRARPAPRNADERYRMQRDCFIAHLSASYKDVEDIEHQPSPHQTSTTATSGAAGNAALLAANKAAEKTSSSKAAASPSPLVGRAEAKASSATAGQSAASKAAPQAAAPAAVNITPQPKPAAASAAPSAIPSTAPDTVQTSHTEPAAIELHTR